MTPETINVIATVVVALANALLAIFTYRYMRLTGHMLDHMRSGQAATVVADLTFDGYSAYLAVTNSGNVPATNVRFVKATGFDWVQHPSWQEVIQHGISYLPAGRTMKYWLGRPHWENIKETPSIVHVKIEYESAGETTFRDFIIDMSQYLGASVDSSPVQQLVEAIREVAEARNRDPDRLAPMIFLSPKKSCVECAEPIPAAARKCSHCLSPQPASESGGGASAADLRTD